MPVEVAAVEPESRPMAIRVRRAPQFGPVIRFGAGGPDAMLSPAVAPRSGAAHRPYCRRVPAAGGGAGVRNGVGIARHRNAGHRSPLRRRNASARRRPALAAD
ncbi:hypothetical protein G6F63_016450 [Rhizopus arrhizus]|nr:hypothetical protein G6F63_016450 [Rhizopus arrhizus]